MCGNIFYNFISYKKYYSDKNWKINVFYVFFCGYVRGGHWRGEYGGTVPYPPTKPQPPFYPFLHPNLYPLRGVPTYTLCQK